MELRSESILRGNERILVVDDEEMIVILLRKMLEHLGYKVTALTDGREALRMFSEKPSDFDLVMTDHMMPHLTGKDIGCRMIRIRSDIPIIMFTGSVHLISPEEVMGMGFRGILGKPFTVQECAKLVRRVLDQ